MNRKQVKMFILYSMTLLFFSIQLSLFCVNKMLFLYNWMENTTFELQITTSLLFAFSLYSFVDGGLNSFFFFLFYSSWVPLFEEIFFCCVRCCFVNVPVDSEQILFWVKFTCLISMTYLQSILLALIYE